MTKRAVRCEIVRPLYERYQFIRLSVEAGQTSITRGKPDRPVCIGSTRTERSHTRGATISRRP